MTKEQAYDFVNDWMERQKKLAGEYVMENKGELDEFNKGKFAVMGIVEKMLKELNEQISSSEAQ